MNYIVSAALAVALLAPTFGAAAAAPSNLALNKPVSSSSVQGENLTTDFAVDGDVSTRWGSGFSEGAYR